MADLKTRQKRQKLSGVLKGTSKFTFYSNLLSFGVWDDHSALKNDWETVGRDIQVSIGKVAKKYDRTAA